jgi:Tfp pilus assembly protein PilP
MTRATILSRGLSVLGCWLAFGALAAAQAASGVGRPAPSASTTGATPPVQGYSYNPDGRRDPFVSLVNRGSDTTAASSRPSGLAGLMMHEIAVKGIVRSRGALVAMIEAPDAKTYLVRRGDRLFDASVKAVTTDAVVFVQQVNDPLSLVKQREIRKPLRVAEEGK